MMPKKPFENRDEVRDTCINVPMNNIERRKVQEAAKQMHVTMATYIRYKLFYEENGR